MTQLSDRELLVTERVEDLLDHLRRHYPDTYVWALLAAERGLRPGEIAGLKADDFHFEGSPLPISPRLAKALEDAGGAPIADMSGSRLGTVFRARSAYDGNPAVSLHDLRLYFLRRLQHLVDEGALSLGDAATLAHLKTRRPPVQRTDDT